MSQSSQRDVGDQLWSKPSKPLAPTTPDMRRPPLPSASPNPSSKTAWESDMLDQTAVQRLLLEGMYRRAGHQSRFLERIAKQSEEQWHVQRQMFSALVFVMLFQFITALLLIVILYRVFTPYAIP